MQLIILFIAVVLFVSYAGLIIYYRVAWNSIPELKGLKPIRDLSTFISVIIPARNEELNIRSCIDDIIKQSYPAHLFEVLVIDDHSTDKTAAIAGSFSEKNIRLISLRDHLGDAQLNSYKKKAIEIGIQSSNGALIVTTDADCQFPVNWLWTVASFYEVNRPAFIAAPVSMNFKNNFLEIFQALDFTVLQGITAAAVHKKKHNMCNGANMAYEKKAFYEVGGFQGIDGIASGDDMLLMQKIYTRFPKRVLFLKSKDATVCTPAQRTIKDFFQQRIRWASKADKYEDKKLVAVLVLVYAFNVILLLLPVISIFSDFRYAIFNIQFSFLGIWAVLLTGKTIIELIFLSGVAVFFDQRKLQWFFPLMQPFHILYTVIAGWLGKFGTYQWKDRKVK